MKSNPQSLERDLVIIGLPLRTSATTAADDIGPHWQRFFNEGWLDRLPQKDGDIYAVYCDYESDGNGAYTMVLGRVVNADTAVPAGLRRVRVPSGRYAGFDVKGAPPALWQAWSHINGDWEEAKSRRFIADIERHRAGSTATSIDSEILVGID